MDPELSALCVQTVTIARWTGKDVDQKPTFAAAVSYAARVESGNRLVKTSDGRTVATTGQVILVPISGTALPSVRDQLTLPSTYPVTQPPILTVQAEVDENGTIDHITVSY